MNASVPAAAALTKIPTGIMGLDIVLNGGLPKGRPTLVCGGPGTGKTMLALEFLVHGVQQGEPGVFVTFEEDPEELATNAASLGFDLPALIAQKQLVVDRIETDGAIEGGAFDLEALFIRLRLAIDTVGAKRIAFDTLENLFSGLPDPHTLRAEVHRLFGWLKEQGLTALVTAEAGDGRLTRDGLEEYVSDCVLALEQNIVNQVATRRIRIVKYRGSAHGTNQYPFVINEHGFQVVPITSSGMRRRVSRERASLGVPGLDAILGGEGPYRGSVVLVSGTAGTGKTTLAAHAVEAGCARGERCTFYSFEQTADAIIRDTGTLGESLRRWADEGLLRFEGTRPTTYGLDDHLASIRAHVASFRPHLVVLDPISGFGAVGATWETKNMLSLIVDAVAEVGATLVMTSLTEGGLPAVATEIGISSLADVWILIEDPARAGVRHRLLSIVKARGTEHSHERHDVRIDGNGMHVLGPYLQDARGEES